MDGEHTDFWLRMVLPAKASRSGLRPTFGDDSDFLLMYGDG